MDVGKKTVTKKINKYEEIALTAQKLVSQLDGIPPEELDYRKLCTLYNLLSQVSSMTNDIKQIAYNRSGNNDRKKSFKTSFNKIMGVTE